jgi:hypothetical protein
VGQALDLLEGTTDAAAELVALIRKVVDRYSGHDLKCILAKYSFLDHVARAGVPYLPGGAKFDQTPDYIVEDSFPFGFVIHNALSVEVPNTTSKREKASRVLALLKPGTPIGLFELLDGIFSRHKFPVQPWTITAGSANVFALSEIQSKTHCTVLNKAYDERVSKQRYSDATTLHEALSQFTNWGKAISGWSANVVYFSNALIDLLGIKCKPHELCVDRARLVACLSHDAASRLADSQSYFDGLWHEFRTSQTSEGEIKSRQSAFVLWSKILAVKYSRIPAYKICNDCDLTFPMTKTLDFVAVDSKRRATNANYAFLVPTSRKAGVVYLPVDELTYFDRPKDLKEDFFEILEAYRDSNGTDKNLMIPGPQFFSSIKLRLAAREEDQIFQKFKVTESFETNPSKLSGDFKPIGPKHFIDEEWWAAPSDADVCHLKFHPPMNALVRIDLDRLQIT